MIRALYTAASGMTAQQMNLDTIANNLANSSTTGFRQLRLQFQDMIYQNLITPGCRAEPVNCFGRTADWTRYQICSYRGHHDAGRAQSDLKSTRCRD